MPDLLVYVGCGMLAWSIAYSKIRDDGKRLRVGDKVALGLTLILGWFSLIAVLLACLMTWSG